jgi:hypothetical protein
MTPLRAGRFGARRRRATRFGAPNGVMAGVFVVLMAIAAPAALDAQARTQPPAPPRARPAPPKPRIGIRGYVAFGTARLAANESFDAVAEPRSSAVFGGVQVTNLWKGVFADLGFSRLSLDGERVFVDDRRVFRLGIPLEVTMRPVDITGGWRLALMRGRIAPYAGAGLTYLHYEETSAFAGSGEDVSESKAGPVVIGGVDVRVWRWILAGGELRWRRVRGILGERGVSAEFGENDAGGINVGVRISVGR